MSNTVKNRGKLNARNRSPIEEFLALPDAEKEKIAREFEDPASARTFRPLNAAERRIWARAKKRMGRPVKGKGCRVISLSVERGLLEKADALASKKGLTRASLVAAGLSAVLRSPGLLE